MAVFFALHLFCACFECHGNHSVSVCKTFASRKANEAALKAQLAESQAHVARLESHPIASVARVSEIVPTPYGVWNDDY